MLLFPKVGGLIYTSLLRRPLMSHSTFTPLNNGPPYIRKWIIPPGVLWLWHHCPQSFVYASHEWNKIHLDVKFKSSLKIQLFKLMQKHSEMGCEREGQVLSDAARRGTSKSPFSIALFCLLWQKTQCKVSYLCNQSLTYGRVS